jgi:hypothetical protein
MRNRYVLLVKQKICLHCNHRRDNEDINSLPVAKLSSLYPYIQSIPVDIRFPRRFQAHHFLHALSDTSALKLAAIRDFLGWGTRGLGVTLFSRSTTGFFWNAKEPAFRYMKKRFKIV